MDLGGSTFRVLLVKVMADGEQKVEMENQIYAIPDHLMKGSGTEVSHTCYKVYSTYKLYTYKLIVGGTNNLYSTAQNRAAIMPPWPLKVNQT